MYKENDLIKYALADLEVIYRQLLMGYPLDSVQLRIIAKQIQGCVREIRNGLHDL